MAWESFETWATERGFDLCFWHTDELPPRQRWWVGVVVIDRARLGRAPGELTFDDHAFCMVGDRVLVDPMASVRSPPGMRLAAEYSDPDAITYGLTLAAKEE